jgi:hypothetical protein
MKRNAVYICLLCFLLMAGAAVLWARDDHMTNSTLDPSATGNIHTDTDHNGNTDVKVTVKHLAKPENLSPRYQTYVVWLRPRDQQPINVGELRVNGNLEGSLETRTPYKDFDVVVTAENDPRTNTLSGPEVLHGTVSRH